MESATVPQAGRLATRDRAGADVHVRRFRPPRWRRVGLWIGVIVAGRLLTFYRPFPCGPAGPGFIAQCLPNYYGQAPR